MSCIIILKVRKFHQPTANRFSTAKEKTCRGHIVPPSLNMVKLFLFAIVLFFIRFFLFIDTALKYLKKTYGTSNLYFLLCKQSIGLIPRISFRHERKIPAWVGISTCFKMKKSALVGYST